MLNELWFRKLKIKNSKVILFDLTEEVDVAVRAGVDALSENIDKFLFLPFKKVFIEALDGDVVRFAWAVAGCEVQFSFPWADITEVAPGKYDIASTLFLEVKKISGAQLPAAVSFDFVLTGIKSTLARDSEQAHFNQYFSGLSDLGIDPKLIFSHLLCGVGALLESIFNKQMVAGKGVPRKYKPHKSPIKDVVIISDKRYLQKTQSRLPFKVEWSHSWEVMGHWRKCKLIGKDREGSYCIPGFTWVVPHVKGDGELVIKTRIKTGVSKHV